MGTGVDSTQTTLGQPAAEGGLACQSLLFLAIECDRPSVPSARYSLADLDLVSVGRGSTRRVTRSRRDGLRVLRIDVGDPRMSAQHARIERAMGKWIAVDQGSKNGMIVNGETVANAALEDGDLLELGHTVFLFRKAMTIGPDQPGDVEVGDCPTVPRGLTTLIPSLARDFRALERIAPSAVSVVVRGASGTGKELVARALHQMSGRRGRFVAINCGGLADTLTESELFGYRRGAFSGAAEDRQGLIRSADGGTLLLDELGDLPLTSQAALLRVLQEGEVTAVGATTPEKIDVRIIAATNRDLDAMVERGEFRGDLLARLDGYSIELPALCRRREDLGLLIGTLLGSGAEPVTIRPEAVRAIFAYGWPFNIRELRKCLDTAHILAAGEPIGLAHLPERLRQLPASTPAETAAASLSPGADDQRQRIVDALQKSAGNQTRAARLLGVSRRTLTRWLSVHAIPRPKKDAPE